MYWDIRCKQELRGLEGLSIRKIQLFLCFSSHWCINSGFYVCRGILSNFVFLLSFHIISQHAQGFENKSSRISIANCDDLSKPIFTKNLEKAQEINPIFSPDGHKLLILTQTYMDETGKSYYGEITLYYYDVNIWEIIKIINFIK